MFQLNAPVKTSASYFSELKFVTDNLLFIYAEANWEATESVYWGFQVGFP